jgi:hypothetical protein
MLSLMRRPLRRPEPRQQIERACARVGECERLGLGDALRRQALIEELREVLARARKVGEPLLAEVQAFVTGACQGWEQSDGLKWIHRHHQARGALDRLVRLGAVPQVLSELLGDYERALKNSRPAPTLARRKSGADQAQPLRKACSALGQAATACEVVNEENHYVPAELILRMRRLSEILQDAAELRETEDWPLLHETVAIQRHITASTGGHRDEQVSWLLNAVHAKAGRHHFRRTPESLERFRRQHPVLYNQPGRLGLSILLAGDRGVATSRIRFTGRAAVAK